MAEKIFFLGGKDAEMSRIKEILLIKNQKLYDKNLPWNDANLSSYKSELEALPKDAQPVFIELKNDIQAPDNAVNIDPVGDKWFNASLLQVCEMIGHTPLLLDVYIAANDHDWIPGMQKLGASSEEISMIRQAERDSQGITKEQEEEAERAISEMETFNGLQIVRMKHSKTAPVTDRLYDPKVEQNLLIISDDGELNYYGNGWLCEKLQGKEIGEEEKPWGKSKIYDNFGGWSGGGGLGKKDGIGFWGGYADPEKVLKFIKENHPQMQKSKSKSKSGKQISE